MKPGLRLTAAGVRTASEALKIVIDFVVLKLAPPRCDRGLREVTGPVRCFRASGSRRARGHGLAGPG